MRLVSNNLAFCGSSGVAPFVAVCGAVSVFVTVITSPFLTVSVAGVYAGFPSVEAPEGIVNATEGPPGAAPPPPEDALVGDVDGAFDVLWVRSAGLISFSVPVPCVTVAFDPGCIIWAIPVP